MDKFIWSRLEEIHLSVKSRKKRKNMKLIFLSSNQSNRRSKQYIWWCITLLFKRSIELLLLWTNCVRNIVWSIKVIGYSIKYFVFVEECWGRGGVYRTNTGWLTSSSFVFDNSSMNLSTSPPFHHTHIPFLSLIPTSYNPYAYTHHPHILIKSIPNFYPPQYPPITTLENI